MKGIHTGTQRGVSLIFVVLILLIVGMIGAVLVSLINTESFTAMHQSAGLETYAIADGGIERALFQFKSGTACNSLDATNVVLGSGDFDIDGTLFNPSSTTLTSGISSTDSNIPVGSIGGYAPHGRIRIESEEINYTGTSSTNCTPFSTPCFTGAQRGMAGTTTTAHSSGLSVLQTQCLIRSTGSVSRPQAAAQRVVEVSLPAASTGLPAASAPFLDGGSTAIGTSETNIGSLSTTLPAGNNLIIVVVSLRNVSGLPRDINAGNLRLQKGAAVLASNQNLIRVGESTLPDNDDFPQETQGLLFKDAGAASSPTYDVTALATGAGISGEVKMIVINTAPNSSFQDGGNVGIGTTETTILSHATTLPAGDNVMIAAVQLDNTSNDIRTINAGNLRLKKGASILASNEITINIARSSRANRGTGVLLMARDPGASSSPTYTLTGLADNTGINGEAKMMVLNGMPSAFLDTGSVAVGTTETVIGSLGTTFKAGENVVIAANQYENTSTTGTPGQRNILAGNERIVASGATQSSNEFEINLCAASGGGTAVPECNDFASGLLWRQPISSPNPTFDVRVLASGTGINAETKIMAIHINVPSIDRPEMF